MATSNLILNMRLRVENKRLAEIIERMTLDANAVRRHCAAVGETNLAYGEQCDDAMVEPASKPATFPARALRYQTQRIGLFVPR